MQIPMTTQLALDEEDHLFIEREAKARGIPFGDMLREMINQADMRIIPGSEDEIREQLDRIAREAIKRARQIAIARDC